MDPIKFYRSFDQEYFYSFHKHSSDLELDELGKRYSLCLDKQGQTFGEILTGKRSPKKLRNDTRQELGEARGPGLNFQLSGQNLSKAPT